MIGLALLTILAVAPDSPDLKFRQPQVAARREFVAMAFGAANDVWFTSSRDGGKTFGSPAKIGTAGVLSLGMRRGPRVAIADGAVLVSGIAGDRGRGQDGDLVVWRSTDEGRTWSQPRKLNGVPGSAREGLHGMAGSGRTVFVTWLDLRGRTALYGKVSRDAGDTWSDDFLVYQSPDGHICECCHPTAAIDANGDLVAMWRNWLGGSRDLWIARSADGGASWIPAKSGAGTWPLNACPMDGGGIAVLPGGRIKAAWRRDKSVYVADGNKETELGTGKDPAILARGSDVYFAWVRDGSIALKLPGHDIEILGSGVAPVMAGSVLAWEDNGVIRVRRLD